MDFEPRGMRPYTIDLGILDVGLYQPNPPRYNSFKRALEKLAASSAYGSIPLGSIKDRNRNRVFDLRNEADRQMLDDAATTGINVRRRG